MCFDLPIDRWAELRKAIPGQHPDTIDIALFVDGVKPEIMKFQEEQNCEVKLTLADDLSRIAEVTCRHIQLSIPNGSRTSAWVNFSEEDEEEEEIFDPDSVTKELVEEKI